MSLVARLLSQDQETQGADGIHDLIRIGEDAIMHGFKRRSAGWGGEAGKVKLVLWSSWS